MKKLKEYKVIILGLIILGFVFYWFQLRPVQIKKECFSKHLAPRDGSLYEQYLREKNDPINNLPAGEKAYDNCLREHGL